ncbi:MAG: hypothetical protein HY521_04880 [Proteobacteria bacterium]|nr:hypothetical protein [Pseudomonadota bacterium]
MESLTWERHGEMALANARRNRGAIARGRSLAELRGAALGEGDSAIVVAAGPSVRRRDPIRAIRDSGFRGALVVTESALAYCLRNGVVPHLAVSLDPHATRIVRWFGDPRLTAESISADDYFGRQDMDEAFANELKANREILSLLGRHGRDIRIALASSASEAVVERVLEAGMGVYWWNPMLDDPDAPGSVTRELQRMNGLPCVNAGGNVGTACWMMAGEVLGKAHVAVTGMDFSYYDGTPYRNTQYYNEAVALVGEERLDSVYVRLFNPHLGAWFYTDPAYYWYRQAFLELAVDSAVRTYNCTEGGILFGTGVEVVPLKEFLARRAPGGHL